LGLSKKCMTYDVNLGCSAFVYGLFNACCVLQSGSAARCLLTIGAGRDFTCEEDQSLAMLMGNAGSVIALERTDNGDDIISTSLFSDGMGYDSLIVPAGGARKRMPDFELKEWPDGYTRTDINTFMDGERVFKFAISEVPSAVKYFFENSGVTKDDFDYFVFHQANKFIIDNIRKRIRVDWGKVPLSLPAFGNTAGCTIPLTLTDMVPDVQGVKKILASGFGVGLSWGVASFSLDFGNVLPILETDEYYKEAFIR